MLDVTLFGIPIIVVIAIAVVVVAMIAFLLYTFHVKQKVGRYSEDFAKAINEFNSLCNPGRLMPGEECEHPAFNLIEVFIFCLFKNHKCVNHIE